MAKITRATQTLFASSASAGQIAQYGSGAAGGFTGGTTYSGATATPANVQALSAWVDGWFSAVDGQYNPAIEDVNAVDWLYAYQLCYLFQEGVSEWDSGTTYYKGSIVQDGSGNMYVSLTDTNLNNALTSATNWASVSGVQSITAVNSASSPYTMSGNERVIEVDASSGAVTINLPDRATYKGRQFIIDRIDGTVANAVNLVCAGSDTFAEPVYTTTYPFDQYESHTIFSGSSKWKVRG